MPTRSLISSSSGKAKLVVGELGKGPTPSLYTGVKRVRLNAQEEFSHSDLIGKV